MRNKVPVWNATELDGRDLGHSWNLIENCLLETWRLVLLSVLLAG